MRTVNRSSLARAALCALMTLSWRAAPTQGQEAAQLPPQIFPADVPPTNDFPNPYMSIEHFGVLYDRVWGATSSVAVDRDGKSLWVGDRCGAMQAVVTGPNASPFTSDNCAGSNLDPILEFDHWGKLVKHFGKGMFIFLHGIFVDKDGNVWVVDERKATAQELEQSPGAKGKGLTVVKFSPDGKVLMTLGTPGVNGDPPNAFQAPTSVLVAPNGDIFVADGHGGPGTGATTSRIVKFDRNGKFIKTFGTLGHSPGQLYHPHSLAMDSAGRLYVADRSNFRIAIFDQDGNWIEAWYQFGRPSGVYIDKDDMIYVGDSESNAVQDHDGWERGIRIGSVKDGKVRYFIPDTRRGKVSNGSGPEGVTVDDQGNVYAAEVGQQEVVKHIPYDPYHQ
jgi:sugar lactone lactonase YvrE